MGKGPQRSQPSIIKEDLGMLVVLIGMDLVNVEAT